jgi:hypothetical protein
VRIEKIGEAPARPLPRGARPLSGLRVLDLTRIIAGPVAGRVLAAHGADVMLISAPGLPFIDWLAKDTGRGKLSAYADITTPDGQAAMRHLIKDADIFVQAFRPGALAARGFGPKDIAALRPGIVYASLSAYGDDGPWASRRGFDSLVQTATGFNSAEARAAGVGGPKELPCQALDHASGYLLAFGAIMARIRQAREGGSWLVRVSLAATGRWIWNLGRVEDGFSCSLPSRDDVADLLETSQSPFGAMRGVRHAAQLSETPATWTRPSVPFGTDPPVWPSIAEVAGLELDRCAVRRAFARALPGLAGPGECRRVGQTFVREDAFERGEPVMIIGLAGVRIAGRLRFLDFCAEGSRPFPPGEKAALVERNSECKCLRFPRLVKYRAVVVARNRLYRLGRTLRCCVGRHR